MYLSEFCNSPQTEEKRQMLKTNSTAYLRLMYAISKDKDLQTFKLALMQFKKGTKESEYLSVLQGLKPAEVSQIAKYIFKDRLFSSLSNYCYYMS
jgi:hypothetical protein